MKQEMNFLQSTIDLPNSFQPTYWFRKEGLILFEVRRLRRTISEFCDVDDLELSLRTKESIHSKPNCVNPLHDSLYAVVFDMYQRRKLQVW